MKTTRKILTLVFALAIANITTIFAQNWAAGKKANPSTDFEYKLNDSGSGAAITAYIGKSPEVIIPEKLDKMPVTDIEGLSSNVQKVFMPDTVKTFTTKTFSGNKKLEEVVLSKNLIELPPSAFANCTSLKTIYIPTRNYNIPDALCKSCTGLQKITIAGTPQIIGESAFQDCASLTTVTIPDTILEIRSDAFKGCKQLKNINFGFSKPILTLNKANELPFTGCPLSLPCQSTVKKFRTAPYK